jgi:hypothetical protein
MKLTSFVRKYCGHVLGNLSNYRWRYPTFHLNNPFRGSTLSILCACSSGFATWVLHLRPCVQCFKFLPRSFRDKFSVPLHRLAAWISLVFACLHSSGGCKQSRTLLYITLFLIMQEQYFIRYLRTRNTRCSTVYIFTHSTFESQLPRCGNAEHRQMQVTGQVQYIAKGGGGCPCCFPSLPLCVYRFSSHCLNNIIFYRQ